LRNSTKAKSVESARRVTPANSAPHGSGVESSATIQVASSSAPAIARLPSAHGRRTASGRSFQYRSVRLVSAHP
jgi:hypothetical protein